MGKMRNAYTIWLENLKDGHQPEDRRRLEDNIKMNLRGKGLEVLDWIHIALGDRWRAVVNTLMDFRDP
jgi:hypothetical protein